MRNTRNHNGTLNIVNKKIQYYRKLNNLSYQELSNKLMFYGVDIHRQSLYKIETGARTVVDYELCAFAKCFNITVNDLVSDFFKELDNT